jgi:hypothetical protein
MGVQVEVTLLVIIIVTITIDAPIALLLRIVHLGRGTHLWGGGRR